MNPADDLKQASAEQASAELDQPLTRALERVPQIAVADDFALRVMRGLPERGLMPQGMSAPGVGRRVAFGALMILFVAMLALGLAARGAGHPAYIVVECVLAAEFIALTLWLSLRAQTSG